MNSSRSAASVLGIVKSSIEPVPWELPFLLPRIMLESRVTHIIAGSTRHGENRSGMGRGLVRFIAADEKRSVFFSFPMRVASACSLLGLRND